MPVETEIKLRLPQGAATARALLEELGFQPIGPRQIEMDQTFDLPAGDLRQTGRLLRLRSTGEKWTITYKGPVDKSLVDSRRLKSREEIEVDVSGGPAITQILERLGYRPSFAYEKFRTMFKNRDENGVVMLDETPIGDFMELEGPASWIDQTAQQLGFAHADYVTSSYATLYAEYCEKTGTVPGDMKFHHP